MDRSQASGRESELLHGYGTATIICRRIKLVVLVGSEALQTRS